MNDDQPEGKNRNRVERIFSAALDFEDWAARSGYLDTACAGSPELRRRVEALLAAARAAPIHFFPGDPQTVVFKPEKAGDEIGPYTLIKELGSGGFGVVWKAMQASPLRREVALKIIKIGMDTREVIARFEAERQALAKMEHPNIAKIYDAGTTDSGRPFFVMELINGRRVDEYCDLHCFSTRQRLNLFTQVCRAIQHAHFKGIIHRDITPSNVLVVEHDGAPVAKVIDFGIAKATLEPSAAVQTGRWEILGKAAYMSPEQTGGGSDIDTRADIYGLGALLYELLAGKTPLEAEELRESALDAICREIREAERPTPSARLKRLKGPELNEIAKRRHIGAAKLPGLLSGELEWIVMKCLERDRERRWQDASRLLENVQCYLDDKPLPDPQYNLRLLYWVERLIRRHKPAFAIGLTCVAASLYFWFLPGTLVMRVRPADARIEIDGHAISAGPMPLELKLSAGAHEVGFSKKDYGNESRTVVVRRGGRAELPEVTLSHYQGKLEVETYPPGAGIHLAAVDYYERIKDHPIDTGNYDLGAFANECFDTHHNVAINPGQLCKDRLSLEHGIAWKYASAAIQGGLVLITNTPPNVAPVIVHAELDRIIFMSSDSGSILTNIPTPNGRLIAFKELDLGGNVGKAIICGFEDATEGVTAELLSASWPFKVLWAHKGPPVNFKEPCTIEVAAISSSNSVANVAVAGRDGYARLFDGGSGTPVQDIVLSAGPLESQPVLASWNQDGHSWLLAALKVARGNESGPGEAKSELACFDVVTGRNFWRRTLGVNQNVLFAELPHSGGPLILLWNDEEWQVVDASTGAFSDARKLPGPIMARPVLADVEGPGTNVLIFQFTNASLPMLAVRPSDGTTIWSGPPNLDNPPFRTSANLIPHTANGALLVGLNDSLVALDVRSGKTLWKIADKARGVLVDDNSDSVYATIEQKGLLCLNSRGQTNWLLQLREDVVPWAIVPNDPGDGKGSILLHRWAGAISMAHWPRLLWEAAASGPLQATPMVTPGDDGRPVVLELGPWGNNVTLRAMNGMDGGVRWASEDNFSPNRALALADLDGHETVDVVGIGGLKGSSGNRLIALRATDGEPIRAPAVDLHSWMAGTPAIADFRGIGAGDVAVSTWENSRVALADGRSGDVLWQYPIEGPSMNSIAAADLDGDRLPDVVATSFDGHVYALRGKDGKLLWKTRTNQYVSWSPPTVASLDDDGSSKVIVTTIDGQLFVLNGANGEMVWSPNLIGGGKFKVSGRATVVRRNGEKVVIAPMGNAGMIAYDWQGRKELWRSPPGYPVIAAGAICDLAHNGRTGVVTGATTGDVFVLSLTDGKPLWHAKVGDGLIEADPVVADLDGDGIDDILIADNDFRLYAISGRRIVAAMGRDNR